MNDLKLNLGAGDTIIEGFTPVDVRDGQKAYPLAYEDNSAVEIRASHILEHFSHTQTADVLKDWRRVLKPGGRIRIAVPDFDYVVEHYKDGTEEPIEGYLLGGHHDDYDVHLAIFNRQKLTGLMEQAGFHEIKEWQSDVKDCAAMKVSLNLEGMKDGQVEPPAEKQFIIAAAMSVPRLGFMDNYFCAFQALLPLKVHLRKHTGAFWGQCLERCMIESLIDKPDAILTIDYDTIFTRQDVEALIQLMREHPEADAIASLQGSRVKSTPLMTIRGEDGKNIAEMQREMFEPELLRINTAHFGLTLIRTEKLRQLPHPWFKAEPGRDGNWGEDRIDDDIWFWKQWEKAGNSLYLANRVVIGHAELMIRWPNVNLEPMHQHPSEFWDIGKPEGVWQ